MNQQRTINRPENLIMRAWKDLLETTCSCSKTDVFNILNKFRLFVLIIRKHDVGLPFTGWGSESEIGDLELNRPYDWSIQRTTKPGERKWLILSLYP